MAHVNDLLGRVAAGDHVAHDRSRLPLLDREKQVPQDNPDANHGANEAEEYDGYFSFVHGASPY
jgi:hypothetical protein